MFLLKLITGLFKKRSKCEHEFRRIGEWHSRIYSETKEKCEKCGHEREIGE